AALSKRIHCWKVRVYRGRDREIERNLLRGPSRKFHRMERREKRLHAVRHLPARGDRSMLRNARFSTLPALVERIQRKRAQRLLRFLGRKRKQTRDHGRQPHHEPKDHRTHSAETSS